MNMIVAVASDWGIGKGNDLLFHISADMKRFRALTSGGTVIMGRKTLDSMPGGKALPKWRNIVITRSADFAREGVELGVRYMDCGVLIYDLNTQDVRSGGSGCGCIASVLAGHFIKMLEDGEIKNLLAIGTGALLNPNSVFQKRHIPAVAHLVHLSTEV